MSDEPGAPLLASFARSGDFHPAQTTLRSARPSLETKSRPFFPRSSCQRPRCNWVPGTKYWVLVPQIRSPHRTLGPWRRATLGGHFTLSENGRDVGEGGHGTA